MTAELLEDARILQLPPHSVIVIRSLDNNDGEALRVLGDALKHLGRTDVLVVDLGEDETAAFDILDETAMREHGWVRATSP